MRLSTMSLAAAVVSNRVAAGSSLSVCGSVITAASCYSCDCKYSTPRWLHVQIPSDEQVGDRLRAAVAAELPAERGLEAWRALLEAHATLVRRLETDLELST